MKGKEFNALERGDSFRGGTIVATYGGHYKGAYQKIEVLYRDNHGGRKKQFTFNVYTEEVIEL